jgi:hypothetical protein
MLDQTTIIAIVLAVFAVVMLAGFVNRKQISNFVSGGNNNRINPATTTGPPGASGPPSTGASPVAPNIPDMAVPFQTGSNDGGSESTNAPASMPKPAEGFANPSEPSNVPFAAGNAPNNCYPKNQLNATELLPADPNSKWAQVNPQGAGDIAGKNYLNAGALIGVNTVGQSLRNASHDLRSEPANPQVSVSPWFNSTIEPDINRRMLEIQ